MKQMTCYERVMTTFQHRRPDCVPVFPTLLMQGAAELGLGLKDYLGKGENLAEGQLRLHRKFGYDCVLGVPHFVQDITAFGAGLMYFESGPPSAGEMMIRRYEDVDRMRAPDPMSAPLLRETLQAIRLLAQAVKGRVPILGGCIAPFSLPSMLMGTEMWMDLLLLENDSCRKQVMGSLIKITTEFCVAWANAQLAAGADAIVLADGMASAAVINRRQFIELALPTIRATVPRIQGPVIHEGVGHLHPLLDLLADTGIVGAILAYRDDLAECKRLVGNKICLIGNLNNIEMRRWTPEEMTQKAQAALAAGAPGGGYILAAQGPEIPLGVRDAVIHNLVNAGHAWRYE
ncbi:MAG: uroporphyrinogen decarboxylase family protein [Anaerolineae bacterium]